MPILLDKTDVVPEVSDFKSVLIVPCRFCPAASMAVRCKEPYIQFHRHLLATASYERLIKAIKNSLENRGIRADVFRSHLLHQFVLCMWTPRRREALAKRARKYDALVVLGCEAAVQSISDSVKSTACKVIQGMKSDGVMSIRPRFSLPCNISLELESVSRLLDVHPQSSSEGSARAEA